MAKMPAQRPGLSKQNYSTPKDFLGAVKWLLQIDDFEFDFAAEANNAKADRYFTKDHNALDPKWNWAELLGNKWGWLNPEFSNIRPWAERCLFESRRGARIALLTPASVGANWFGDFVHDQALVYFLNGRLCFIDDWETVRYDHDDPNGKYRRGDRMYMSKPLYPKDTILSLFGPDIAPNYGFWDWTQSIPFTDHEIEWP